VDVCEVEDLYQWERGASLLEMLRFYGGRDELRQCGFYHVIRSSKIVERGPFACACGRNSTNHSS
jgi:hypothetical protein